MLPALQRQKAKLDHLFDEAGKIEDLEMQSHLSRYLCVLVSGLLEQAAKLVYEEYSWPRSNPSIVRYVRNTLDGFRNPQMEKLRILASRFDPAWHDWFDENCSDSARAAVDSIVARRHEIAHGMPATGISLGTMREYYAGAIEIIEAMHQQCGLGKRVQ